MNKFEQKEMKKKVPIKNSWYHWSINFIPNPLKTVNSFKNDFLIQFKPTASDNYHK